MRVQASDGVCVSTIPTTNWIHQAALSHSLSVGLPQSVSLTATIWVYTLYASNEKQQSGNNCKWTWVAMVLWWKRQSGFSWQTGLGPR